MHSNSENAVHTVQDNAFTVQIASEHNFTNVEVSAPHTNLDVSLVTACGTSVLLDTSVLASLSLSSVTAVGSLRTKNSPRADVYIHIFI